MGKISALDLMNSRLTLAVVLTTIMAGVLTFMDSRHASATDVQQLSQIIYDDRIERLEYNIAESERRIKRILIIPLDERTTWEIGELLDEGASLKMYLRKLDRLKTK